MGRLAREKKAVARMEEEVCRRIDGLVRMGTVAGGVSSPRSTKLGDIGEEEEEEEEETGDAFDTAVDAKTGAFVSMAEFCHKVFRTPSTALVSYEGGGEGIGGGKVMNVRSPPFETTSAAVDRRNEPNVDGVDVDEGVGRPSPVLSHPTINGAVPMATTTTTTTTKNGDDDDDNGGNDETQAPPTSESMEDAVAALGLLAETAVLVLLPPRLRRCRIIR